DRRGLCRMLLDLRISPLRMVGGRIVFSLEPWAVGGDNDNLESGPYGSSAVSGCRDTARRTRWREFDHSADCDADSRLLTDNAALRLSDSRSHYFWTRYGGRNSSDDNLSYSASGAAHGSWGQTGEQRGD